MLRIWIGLGVAWCLWGQEPERRVPKHLAPEIYAWFWHEGDFAPEGYRKFVDRIAERSNIGLLTTSLRVPAREVAFAATHDQIGRGVRYAHTRGLRVAFDLDVRLARGTFHKRYPEQMQWMLRLRKLGRGETRLAVEGLRLGDHMTGGGGEYELLAGRLLGAFDRNLQPVEVKAVEQSARVVRVEAAASEEERIVAVAFAYRTPDVFAPALLGFQQEILEQYRDIPLDGALKDEWGFPPVYTRGPREGDFWYSEGFAKAYEKAGGGEMVRDCALMYTGWGVRAEGARREAVNRYMRLILERNVEIERHYYENV
jgi:hypothetical protein